MRRFYGMSAGITGLALASSETLTPAERKTVEVITQQPVPAPPPRPQGEREKARRRRQMAKRQASPSSAETNDA